MKIIYYKSYIYNLEGEKTLEDCEYITTDEEFDQWLECVQKTYSDLGEVTWEEYIPPKTAEELRDEKIEVLENKINELEVGPPLINRITTNSENIETHDMIINDLAEMFVAMTDLNNL